MNTAKIMGLTFGVFALIVSTPAFATTLSFTPTTVSVVAGQTFTTDIFIDAQGATVYTARANVSYPADILEATAFSFESGWIILSQPEYDLIDNTNGLLIKTAGFANGFSDTKKLGTVTFTAKKSGVATINTTDDSLIYDLNGTNTITEQASAQITIAFPTTVQVPSTPGLPALTEGSASSEEPIDEPGNTNAEVVANVANTIPNTAQTAVAGFGAFGIPGWVIALVVIIILLIFGGWWWRQSLKKKEDPLVDLIKGEEKTKNTEK